LESADGHLGTLKTLWSRTGVEQEGCEFWRFANRFPGVTQAGYKRQTAYREGAAPQEAETAIAEPSKIGMALNDSGNAAAIR